MAETLNILEHQRTNLNMCVRLPGVQGGGSTNQSPTKGFEFISTLGGFLTSASESHNKDGATKRKH